MWFNTRGWSYEPLCDGLKKIPPTQFGGKLCPLQYWEVQEIIHLLLKRNFLVLRNSRKEATFPSKILGDVKESKFPSPS